MQTPGAGGVGVGSGVGVGFGQGTANGITGEEPQLTLFPLIVITHGPMPVTL
jgi:hypothetical protein